MTGQCCKICGSSSSIEEHHIIPRAYGGTNGPTIDLCAVCHGAIHAAADAAIAGKFTNNFLSGSLAESISLSTRLINAVKTAYLMTKDDPNKTCLISTRLPANYNNMLKTIQVHLGLTREQTLLFLISNYFYRL